MVEIVNNNGRNREFCHLLGHYGMVFQIQQLVFGQKVTRHDVGNDSGLAHVLQFVYCNTITTVSIPRETDSVKWTGGNYLNLANKLIAKPNLLGKLQSHLL